MTSTIDLLEVNMPELAKQMQVGDTVVITSGKEKIPVLRIEPIATAVESRVADIERLDALHLQPNVPEIDFLKALPEEELKLWYDGGPDDPLHWSEERIRKVNAESNSRWS